MDLDSFAGTVLIGSLSLTMVGLLVLGVAGTRAAVIFGIREDLPWWFAPAGARTQGLVVAYLGVLVAIGASAALAVTSVLPDARSLAWLAACISSVSVLGGTVTRFGRILVDAATNGTATWGEPEEGDFVEPDDALDDVDVRSARAAALGGDWRPAAHLLAATTDADARFDRLDVLARAGLRRRAWLEAWLRERPLDRDALALRAQLAALRAWEIRGGDWRAQNPDRFLDALADAESYAREAIALAPTDPCPHVTLVTIARGQQVDHDELDRRLAGLARLAPHHRQGHEQALQYTCAKWFGSAEEMFRFARDASGRAPEGSAAALLVVAAHVEHWMTLVGRATALADKHMTSEATRAEIAAAESRWRDGDSGPSPVGRVAAHNLLAFAWWLCQDAAAAQEHLAVTREHLSETPWAYADEPSLVHARAQAWAREHAPVLAAAAVQRRAALSCPAP